jgi:hypothetical protein
VRLAARGARDMDRGAEPVRDAGEARQLRGQALRIHAESVVAAVLLTGLALLAAAWAVG